MLRWLTRQRLVAVRVRGEATRRGLRQSNVMHADQLSLVSRPACAVVQTRTAEAPPRILTLLGNLLPVATNTTLGT